MKKIGILVFIAVLPFIVVWTAGIMTFFIVNPVDVFNDSDVFWTLSSFYWIVYCMMFPSIYTLIEEELS